MINGWFDLLGTKTGRKHGEIKMSIQFISKDSQEERTHIMEDAYFPAREGCQMTLYQDANTPQLPVFDGLCHPNGSSYVATNAWKDLYDCITNAQKFIYITGWSVNTNIQLLRGEDDPEGKSNVGELLKAKAEDGVCVLLLLWDEPASSSLGLMGTHCQETKDFFDNDTRVKCILVSREKAGVQTTFKDQSMVKFLYTHHQKTVVCDAAFENDESVRRIVAFIGGLDITNGRYDTPEFPLFKTIKNIHQGDFYQNNFPGITEDMGPREPWVSYKA